MPRWIGFLGSWALLVLAVGLAAIAAAGEWINIRDLRRLDRVELVDKLIEERGNAKANALRTVAGRRSTELKGMQQKMENVSRETDDVPDTGQEIIVSTAENRLYVRDQ